MQCKTVKPNADLKTLLGLPGSRSSDIAIDPLNAKTFFMIWIYRVLGLVSLALSYVVRPLLG